MFSRKGIEKKPRACYIIISLDEYGPHISLRANPPLLSSDTLQNLDTIMHLRSFYSLESAACRNAAANQQATPERRAAA